MISFSNARVVVVAGAETGRPLVHTLTRMGLASVRLVANPDQARQLCTTKNADACLVVLPRPVPDELPQWTAETGAPGREAGIPSSSERARPKVPLADPMHAHSYEAWGGKFKLQ